MSLLRPAAALLLSVVFAAPVWGRSSSAGQGRTLRAPDDPGFEPVLLEIEQLLPACDAVAAANLRVPSPTVDLGPSAKMYRCWKLKLTGDQGKQARDILQRLKSVQGTLRDLRKKLDRNLDLYLASPKPDGRTRALIRAQHRSLKNLLERYRSLIGIGTRNGLIKVSSGGLLSGKRSVTPRLRNEDYTMVYDHTIPGCPERRNPEGL